MARQLVGCFDIDDTLYESGHGVSWDDVESIRRSTRILPAAAKRLQQFVAAGHDVQFLTGRHRKAETLTHAQLRAILGPEGTRGRDVVLRDWNPYDMMRCVVWKADRLAELEPDFYVGDLPMDQTAAAMAGIPFIPAEWWASGKEDLVFILRSRAQWLDMIADYGPENGHRLGFPRWGTRSQFENQTERLQESVAVNGSASTSKKTEAEA